MGGVSCLAIYYFLFFATCAFSSQLRFTSLSTKHTLLKSMIPIPIYGVDALGQPKSFKKGKIISARDVQIQWQEPEKDTAGKETGKEVDVRSFATEFVIEPDDSETFIFVQYNEEELKAGERILLLKENNKIRIVRDRSVRKNKNNK